MFTRECLMRGQFLQSRGNTLILMRAFVNSKMYKGVLWRVKHQNLVGLVGFCQEAGEKDDLNLETESKHRHRSCKRGIMMLAKVMMMWAIITEGLHRTYNVHYNLNTDCPTTKTGLFGGAAFLALDAAIFWLVCQMLTGNGRADSLEDEDPKGTYEKVLVTDYNASGAGQQGAQRV